MSSENTRPASAAAQQLASNDGAQQVVATPADSAVVSVIQPVPANASTNVNVDKYPLTPDAWQLYIKHNTLGRHSYRQFICRRDIVSVARALGRQVTVEELQTFAGLDGEKVTCQATEEEFQPVGFLVFTKRFLDHVSRDKKIDTSRAPAVGCFFVKESARSEEVLALSGHPYGWNTDREFLADWTPLCKAYKANGFRWGFTRAEAEGIVAERKSRREEQDRKEGRIDDTIAHFFGNTKPVERQASPKTASVQGGRVDRRTFVPTVKKQG